MVDSQRSPYLVYMLRMWRDGQDTPWRAVLDCPRTGERHPFADLAALFAFLESETADSQPPPFEDTDSG